MNYSTIGDAIPQVSGLSYSPPDTSKSFQLGGQNFTHCCLLAVNSSLAINNGNLTFTNRNHFAEGQTIESILNSVHDNSFPCGAEFNGDFNGSPIVTVSYRWCTSQCSGWEISHFNKLQQWVGPLVQFLLPSLAFCLNIPRTRKLAVPDFVFQAHPRNLVGFTTYWIRLLVAGLLMLVDTMVWLSICFAFAGPMLLSGVYEFVLDRKILEFLSPPGKPKDRPEIPAKLRAQLLLAVVVGNLRISSGGLDIRKESLVERHDSYGFYSSRHSQISRRTIATDNTWHRVMAILGNIQETQLLKELEYGGVSLATKLKSILMSQASFGSTVGAPILFFVGGFIYTVVDIDNSLGDNDQAHALAFGMWWMTIPYLAIVACAMLSSNSPSALQGIVFDGGPPASRERHEMSFWDQLKDKIKSYPIVKAMSSRFNGYSLIEHTYEGHFQTVPMWNRGPNKRRWIHEAIREYTLDYNSDAGGRSITPDEVRKGLHMTRADKFNTVVGTLFLLLTPTLLAFLTSYNTPRKSLSCRTMTYLVYGISQFCEMLLWLWEASLKVQYGANWSNTKTPAKAISWLGQAFVGFFAVLATVGGTFMQLLGIYRSCACRIPAKYWFTPDEPDAYIVLSTNTADSIKAAQEWWTSTGTAAVLVLSIVCSLCWWHQRRLRKVFQEEADRIDDGWINGRPHTTGTMERVVSSSPISPLTQPGEFKAG